MTPVQQTFLALEDAALRLDMCPAFPAPERTVEALRRIAPQRAARFELAAQLESFRRRLALPDPWAEQ